MGFPRPAESDPYACIHDAYIYDPRSWCLHVWCIYIYMTLDPDACIYDAGMNDAYNINYIHDPWPWCMFLWCGIFLCRTNEPIYDAAEILWPMDGPTIKPIPGVDPDHECMMHVSMFSDLDEYVYAAHLYDAWSYDVCRYGSCMYDAYIYDPWSLIIDPDA